jgi:hypothetical protein
MGARRPARARTGYGDRYGTANDARGEIGLIHKTPYLPVLGTGAAGASRRYAASTTGGSVAVAGC